MSSLVVLNHIVFAAGVLGLTIVLVIAIATAIFFRQFAIADETEENSANVQPSLRTGGFAVIGAFLTGIFLIQMLGEYTPIKSHYFWGFLASLVLLCITSLYSTFKSFDGRLNYFGQALAAAVVMYSGIVIGEIRLPWLGLVVGGWWVYPMTLLWILGLVNAYSGMDMVDGLAASGAVIASSFLSFIAIQQGSVFIYLCSITLFAASVGFLAFNWPPAKIYMGTIGAAFLGFSFAIMAIIAGLYDNSHSSLFVMPLLFFHFIFDAAFYFVTWVRIGRGASLRRGIHLYQLLGGIGYSHRKVILIYSGMGIAQGVGAILLINVGNNRMWVFLPFLLFQLAYAHWLIESAKQKNLFTPAQNRL